MLTSQQCQSIEGTCRTYYVYLLNLVALPKCAKMSFCGQSKHKLALRNLSMVMRQLGGDATERRNNIEESVTLAKNAVQLDITDGTSWCK